VKYSAKGTRPQARGRFFLQSVSRGGGNHLHEQEVHHQIHGSGKQGHHKRNDDETLDDTKRSNNHRKMKEKKRKANINHNNR
jgi:hypothetical protein